MKYLNSKFSVSLTSNVSQERWNSIFKKSYCTKCRYRLKCKHKNK